MKLIKTRGEIENSHFQKIGKSIALFLSAKRQIWSCKWWDIFPIQFLHVATGAWKISILELKLESMGFALVISSPEENLFVMTFITYIGAFQPFHRMLPSLEKYSNLLQSFRMVPAPCQKVSSNPKLPLKPTFVRLLGNVTVERHVGYVINMLHAGFKSVCPGSGCASLSTWTHLGLCPRWVWVLTSARPDPGLTDLKPACNLHNITTQWTYSVLRST